MSKVLLNGVRSNEPMLLSVQIGNAARSAFLNYSHSRRCDVGGRRFFSVTCSLFGRGPPSRKEKKTVEIPGLDRVTYADRMHFVPGLAKPIFPDWQRDWHDPHHYRGPNNEEMKLYKENPCYVFNQRTKILEGVRQALWLTKSKLIQGLPEHILALAEDPANQIEDQDERVQQAIRHSRFWDTTAIRPKRDRFCPVLFRDLLHLCGTLQVKHTSLSKRILAENYRVAALWNRESDVFQVRGLNGMLLNSMTPLPAVAQSGEVLATENHTLETFYPISPTIDLQCTYVYDQKNDTGFREGYPYPHTHTLFFTETEDSAAKFKPEQLRAKMIMFAFGNALARAKSLYGEHPQVLEHPVVVQSVATDGRLFQFIVLQLNTTDLGPDTGVKNLVWMDQDQLLYDYAKCRPLIKKKVVTVPAGLSGYQPETFKKFLALHLHGAV
ncbi:39S ribosomal protein L37, mitochondrial [Acipenser oxyrinchus oxyrinchus]|uniref:Large ribosomal subunit protein mL37 n=1 Tax=Acipenser oxyrinchus oxyrinchus TaxID=40147 RepID=A0AAD8D8F2_ACIOX|nr:39S ribosomal protein L37, mitochondrial [Acipenser oxyrinchus oxyrinchus]